MSSELYTPEIAVDLRIASDVQVSPDGTRVAFCLAPIGHRNQHPTSTIYLAPVDGSRRPFALTSNAANNVSPRWSTDGSMLAFISDREKRGTGQLYVMRPDGGGTSRLTDFDGGVQHPGWTCDGRHVLFTVRRQDLTEKPANQSEIYVASESARPRTIAMTSIYGGAVREVGPAHGHVWAFTISPDGRQLAALVSPTDQLAAAANQSWLIVFPLSNPSQPRSLARFVTNVDQLSWSSDSSHIVLVNGLAGDHRESQVQVVNVPTGRIVTHDDRGRTPVWAGFDRDGLVVLSVENQTTRLDQVHIDGSATRRLDLSGSIEDFWIQPQVSFSRDRRSIAFLAARQHHPSEVFVRRPDGSVQQLSDVNPQLSSLKLAEMEEMIWDGPDGTRIHGWLLRPTKNPDRDRYPLVVNVHGGPSMAWGNWFHGTWHDWAQVLAARGYAVLLPNQRGSTGKGQEFTGANRADLGGKDFQDVMAGVDQLIECRVADPERLGIGGWSYGGFLTAITIVRTERFRAAVAGAAVTNWASKVGTTDIRPYNEWNFPGALHEAPDPYWIRSPIRYLRYARTPTLIVHGQADERVPVSQGHEFYLGLKAQGVNTDLVTYPRQGHAFHEREFQLDLLQRICRWFDHYLDADEEG